MFSKGYNYSIILLYLILLQEEVHTNTIFNNDSHVSFVCQGIMLHLPSTGGSDSAWPFSQTWKLFWGFSSKADRAVIWRVSQAEKRSIGTYALSAGILPYIRCSSHRSVIMDLQWLHDAFHISPVVAWGAGATDICKICASCYCPDVWGGSATRIHISAWSPHCMWSHCQAASADSVKWRHMPHQLWMANLILLLASPLLPPSCPAHYQTI